MHRGSCLCGAVTYEVSGDFGDGYFCHCQRCRKATGSAYASNAKIRPEQFRLLSGQGVLALLGMIGGTGVIFDERAEGARTIPTLRISRAPSA